MRFLQPATAVSRALRKVLARTELKSSFAATTSMVVCEPHKRANRATLRGGGITQRAVSRLSLRSLSARPEAIHPASVSGKNRSGLKGHLLGQSARLAGRLPSTLHGRCLMRRGGGGADL